MRYLTAAIVLLPLLGLPHLSEADAKSSARERTVEEIMAKAEADRPTGGTEMTYGTDARQKLLFWKGASPQAPLILFVHGGSWRAGTKETYTGKAKVDHLTSQGYAFATVGFRLIPAVTIEQQVQDVGDALAYLVKNAASLGFDPERVVLMGHSSGAHVVALLGPIRAI